MANNRKRLWLKWLVILVLLAAAAGGALLFFAEHHAEQPEYQSTKITRGELTQTVTATGQLNPMTNITVGSQISGIIQKLYVDWNSPVKANQVVAQLDPATYKAAVAQAEGDLANTKANLELARGQAKRATELFSNKLISESDFDITTATLHQSEAMVQIKQASLDNARVNLERCTIYSPVDGTIISRSVDIGQTVAASLSAPILFMIANDLTQMQIDANVSEADIGTVEEGQSATFTVDAFPERKFTGKVRQIRNAPITIQNVVTYDTVVDVSNPDLKLRPGMTANASIITATRNGVLRIPNAALRFRPPEPATNQNFAARVLAKLGLKKETKAGATNALLVATATSTNKIEASASAPPLTGNEPPEELMRRVREMRDRGEEVPPEIGAKIRELFQSGAIQRPAGGGMGEGGSRRGGGGAGSRQRPAQPSSRTVYLLTTNAPSGGGEPVPTPQPVRIKTGISDGAYTEVTDGLKEGDTIITSVKQPPAPTAAAPPPGGSSPFGGGFRPR